MRTRLSYAALSFVILALAPILALAGDESHSSAPRTNCITQHVAQNLIDPRLRAYFEAVNRIEKMDAHSPALQSSPPFNRTEAPVSGLYESIPNQTHFASGPVEIKIYDMGAKGHIGYIDLNGKIAGTIHRRYDPQSKTLFFEGANLYGEDGRSATKAPGFLNFPGVIPLVKDRGIPTQAFVTLQIMKQLGIKYGELAHAQTNMINNIRTSLQLIQSHAVKDWLTLHPKTQPPTEVLLQAIRETHSVSYIETVLTQSGHKVVATRMNDKDLRWLSLKTLLMYHRNEIDDSLASLMIQKVENGKPIPLSPDQLIPTYFQIEFDLAPATIPPRSSKSYP